MKEENVVIPDSAFEYAFEEVPKDKRKRLSELTVVLAGFPIALSNFVIGGLVASQLPFFKAMAALAVGNIILMLVVVFLGLIATRKGLSSTFLSREAFGKRGSIIFSILLVGSALTWVSTNADIFARLISTLFAWWPLPIWLTAFITVFMWLISAMLGYKGLALMSKIGVPAAVALAIFGVVFVANAEGGLQTLLSYQPAETITFTAATAAIVGGWIYGATITPDITRFAKNKIHVVIASVIAFSIGCLGFQIAGGLVAISTGQNDFIHAMILSGLGIVAFITATFCLWTTEDKEIYTASLALQNIVRETKYYGKIKHKHTATFFAVIAAFIAAGGIFNYLEVIIGFFSVLIPPVPGIIMAEGFFVNKTKKDQLLNKNAIVSWLIGGILSYIALKSNFFISPVIGIVSAGFFYTIVEKIKEKQLSNQFVIENVKKDTSV